MADHFIKLFRFSAINIELFPNLSCHRLTVKSSVIFMHPHHFVYNTSMYQHKFTFTYWDIYTTPSPYKASINNGFYLVFFSCLPTSHFNIMVFGFIQNEFHHHHNGGQNLSVFVLQTTNVMASLIPDPSNDPTDAGTITIILIPILAAVLF